MAYTIDEKTYTQGNEITITTEPYELYGGWWQDGVDEAGKKYTVMAPEQRAKDIQRSRREWKEQQAGFKRLKESRKTQA